MTTKNAFDIAVDKFHDHLDHCWQCREHPNNLCPVGAMRLREGAQSAMAPAFSPPEVSIQRLREIANEGAKELLRSRTEPCPPPDDDYDLDHHKRGAS